MNKFRPILFSTPMVQAILEGRKTQTRRTKGLEKINENPDDWVWGDTWLKSNLEEISFIQFKKKDKKTCKDYKSFYLKSFPYGNIGDVLWVRETWQILLFKDAPTKYLYKANPQHDAMKWKPSIHMPKAACRLFLRIKDVRVERLQDISEADAEAEGIRVVNALNNNGEKGFVFGNDFYHKATETFKMLWESINGKKMPWKSNPWVWVIEFERIEKPIDF